MKKYLFLLPLLIVVLGSGCSGLVSVPASKGRVVSPDYLARFSGGGSLSTLWYRGSDEKYHYFAHYVKGSTRYRIRRQEFQMPDEFPFRSRDPVFVGDELYWRDLR